MNSAWLARPRAASVDKGVLGGEQMQLVGAHFVRALPGSALSFCILSISVILLVSCFQRGEGDGQYHFLVTQVEHFQAVVTDSPFQDVSPVSGIAYLEGKIINERS